MSITLDICADNNPAHVRFHGVHKAQSSLLSPIKKGGKRRQEVGPLAFGKSTLVSQSPFHFKDLLHHDYDHKTGAFQWLLGLPHSSPRNKQSRVGPGFLCCNGRRNARRRFLPLRPAGTNNRMQIKVDRQCACRSTHNRISGSRMNCSVKTNVTISLMGN